MRSWVIGNGADCDVVVDSPLASFRHCQLTQTPDGFMLDDLGSTNGTYVNGLRITSPTRVTPGEPITLGRTVPMPWPPQVVRYIGIGRVADNDIVLDDARVSGHHARLIVVAGSETLIEDLGSSNGTFLNSADRRATSATPVTVTDTVYFGTLAVPAARLLAGLREPALAVSDPSPPTGVRGPLPEAARVRLAIASSVGNRWTLALLVQAPVFAVLIVLIFGRQAAATVTASSWESVGQGIASTTFALALAAVWLGCAIAVGESAAGRMPGLRESVDSPTRFVSIGLRLAVLAALCAVECTLLLAIVYWGSGLSGPWLAMWGMLVMASGVGLLLGLVVTALSRIWTTAAVVLVLSFLPMIVLGGWLWPLTGMIPPMRLMAEAMPSRWAFEGVLLLESPYHQAPMIPEGSDLTANRDLAEAFFPADSERMGTRADAMALASMLIGLVALAAFIWRLSRAGP